MLTQLCAFILQVCISFVKILYNVTRPHTARLGNIPGTSVYRNVTQYPEATLVPGILPIRVDAAIYFSNSNYIHDKILGYLDEELKKLAKTGGPNIQYLILDLTRTFSDILLTVLILIEIVTLIIRISVLLCGIMQCTNVLLRSSILYNKCSIGCSDIIEHK